MEAEKILSLIRSVDPMDRPALRHIDELVCELWGIFPKPVALYSSSLDAQKSLTLSDVNYFRSGVDNSLRDREKGFAVFYVDSHAIQANAPTEELARLHCIVQLKNYLNETANR